MNKHIEYLKLGAGEMNGELLLLKAVLYVVVFVTQIASIYVISAFLVKLEMDWMTLRFLLVVNGLSVVSLLPMYFYGKFMNQGK